MRLEWFCALPGLRTENGGRARAGLTPATVVAAPRPRSAGPGPQSAAGGTHTVCVPAGLLAQPQASPQEPTLRRRVCKACVVPGRVAARG